MAKTSHPIEAPCNEILKTLLSNGVRKEMYTDKGVKRQEFRTKKKDELKKIAVSYGYGKAYGLISKINGEYMLRMPTHITFQGGNQLG